VGGAASGEIPGFDATNGVVHVRQPAFRSGGMPREHEHAEAMRRAARRTEAQVVQPLALVRRDDSAKGAMEQGIGLLEAGEALCPGEHLRADRFDIVMKPANAPGLVGEDGVGFEDGAIQFLVRGLAVHHHVADLQLREFLMICPPDLDERGGFERRGAVGGDMDDGMMRVHPEADGQGPMVDRRRPRSRLVACGDFNAPLVELEFLAEDPAWRNRIRLEADAQLPDLDEAGIVIPGVGLADVEVQFALLGHPGVERDVTVAQRHRPVMIHAGRIPHDVERVRRCGGSSEGRQRDEADQAPEPIAEPGPSRGTSHARAVSCGEKQRWVEKRADPGSSGHHAFNLQSVKFRNVAKVTHAR